MKIDEKIEDQKIHYITNREPGKISSLSYGKIYKCEYPAGEEILLSSERQIIEQTKFAYSPLEKLWENKKQLGALKSLDLSNKKDELKQIEGIFPENFMNDFIRVKLKEIIKFQDTIKKII